MSDFDPLGIVIHGTDAVPAVRARMYASTELASQPPQYDLAIAALARHAHVPLRHVVDIGCNSGDLIRQAVRRSRLPHVAITGVEVLPYEEATYFSDMSPQVPADPYEPAFSFVQTSATSSELPVERASADAVLALNMLFRAEKIPAWLLAMRSLLRPDGVLAVSSNFKTHAAVRHWTARMALLDVSIEQNLWSFGMPPPAKKVYFPDIVELVRSMPGLRIEQEIVQKSVSVITADTIDEYLASIMFDAPRTDLPARYHRIFREHVRQRGMERLKRSLDRGQPLFDSVHRGILIARRTGRQ
jgi:SAM-dependent methyltransferase